MLRCWLIRSLFLVPLVFVVGVWITSYFGGIAVTRSLGDRTWLVAAVQGHGVCAEARFSSSPMFYFVRNATATDWGWEPGNIGFHVGAYMGYTPSLEIAFPLWLPTLLLALLNWFVWRQTRRKAVAKAFPIEPASSAK